MKSLGKAYSEAIDFQSIIGSAIPNLWLPRYPTRSEVEWADGRCKMSKRIRLPNIDVRLTDDEIAITQTRPFQRLNFLKQLGLAYLVYPGATHTRGAHSLLCLHEANHILSELGNVEESDRAAIRVAALLHDIGHVPFSHTLEDEHLVLEKHDGSNRLSHASASLKTELDTKQRALVDSALPI